MIRWLMRRHRDEIRRRPFPAAWRAIVDRNVPYAALLNPDGTWRDDADLRALFAGVGAFERPRAICYCGGGISATMDALALTRLGHPSVAVYDGSMSEWSRDPTLPMELGA